MPRQERRRSVARPLAGVGVADDEGVVSRDEFVVAAAALELHKCGDQPPLLIGREVCLVLAYGHEQRSPELLCVGIS